MIKCAGLKRGERYPGRPFCVLRIISLFTTRVRIRGGVVSAYSGNLLFGKVRIRKIFFQVILY